MDIGQLGQVEPNGLFHVVQFYDSVITLQKLYKSLVKLINSGLRMDVKVSERVQK